MATKFSDIAHLANTVLPTPPVGPGRKQTLFENKGPYATAAPNGDAIFNYKQCICPSRPPGVDEKGRYKYVHCKIQGRRVNAGLTCGHIKDYESITEEKARANINQTLMQDMQLPTVQPTERAVSPSEGKTIDLPVHDIQFAQPIASTERAASPLVESKSDNRTLVSLEVLENNTRPLMKILRQMKPTTINMNILSKITELLKTADLKVNYVEGENIQDIHTLAFETQRKYFQLFADRKYFEDYVYNPNNDVPYDKEHNSRDCTLTPEMLNKYITYSAYESISWKISDEMHEIEKVQFKTIIDKFGNFGIACPIKLGAPDKRFYSANPQKYVDEFNKICAEECNKYNARKQAKELKIIEAAKRMEAHKQQQREREERDIIMKKISDSIVAPVVTEIMQEGKQSIRDRTFDIMNLKYLEHSVKDRFNDGFDDFFNKFSTSTITTITDIVGYEFLEDNNIISRAVEKYVSDSNAAGRLLEIPATIHNFIYDNVERLIRIMRSSIFYMKFNDAVRGGESPTNSPRTIDNEFYLKESAKLENESSKMAKALENLEKELLSAKSADPDSDTRALENSIRKLKNDIEVLDNDSKRALERSEELKREEEENKKRERELLEDDDSFRELLVDEIMSHLAEVKMMSYQYYIEENINKYIQEYDISKISRTSKPSSDFIAKMVEKIPGRCFRKSE